MALQVNYNYIINIGYIDKNDEIFKNVLTEEQLSILCESCHQKFIIKDAYCRIDTIKGNKNRVEITLGIYKDESKRVCIVSKNYEFVPNLESEHNFIKQGYKYLKTLPEYADAIDC